MHPIWPHSCCCSLMQERIQPEYEKKHKSCKTHVSNYNCYNNKFLTINHVCPVNI